MNNNLINEEIERARLLMGYNSKKTLTENVESTDNEKYLLEGVSNAIVDNIFKDLVKVEGRAGLKSSIESAIKDWGGITIETEKGVYYLSKDTDEIMNAMEKGTLSSVVEAGKLAKSMFKNAGSVEIRSLAGDAIVSMESFGKKYGGMPREQMVERLMGKPASYTKAEAETLAKKFENVRGGGKVNPHPEPVHPEPVPNKPEPIGNEPSWWLKIKEFPYKKAVKYLIGAGIVYWLWKWLTSDEASPFPQCLRGKLSGEDASTIKERGLDNALIISQTGNSDIDAAGGGIFYDDGKFESMNGRYKGNWDGEGPITLNIGDKTYTIECSGTTPIPPIPPKPTPYKDCNDFPLTKGCRGSKVSDIQKCLGVTADGKFGPKTEAALIDKGYSATVTKEVYDKIIKNCGKSTTDTETSIVPDATQSTDI